MLANLSPTLGNLLRREDGPTAVEYAVMLALIVAVCMGTITTLGAKANGTFGSVARNMGNTPGGTNGPPTHGPPPPVVGAP
jgi:pilus assembly protein Flp/PilA